MLSKLVAGRIDGFFALVPGQPGARRSTVSPTMSCVAFDRFRAPLTEAEIERRNPDALSPDEFRNLCQWGYPYVFESVPLPHDADRPRRRRTNAPACARAIDEVFAPTLDEPVPVDGAGAVRRTGTRRAVPCAILVTGSAAAQERKTA